MKYGMPTLVECKDITECVEVAALCGLDFVEINMSFPNYQPTTLDVGKLRALSEKTGVFYTIHADESLNPFDFNPAVSECYFKCMAECIDFALALDIPLINMHLLKGVYVTLPDKVILLNDVYREEYISRVKSFILMCEEKIGSSALKIAIENVDSNPFTESQKEALKLFMKSPVFALTLDTGHDDCLEGKDRFIYNEHPEKLIHMHLHDSDGKHAHLPLGEGRVNIKNQLDLLGENKTCLIEVKTVDGLKKSIKYLETRGLF